jgi:putative solute:sodium symporter small subunit
MSQGHSSAGQGHVAVITPEKAKAYWKETSGHMYLVLAVWAFFAFFVHIFAPSMNAIHVLGFPLGYWFASQGSIVVFIVSIWYYANKQNQIDEKYNVAEE